MSLVLTTEPVIRWKKEVISIRVMRPLRENDTSPLPWGNEFLQMYLSCRKYLHGLALIQGQIRLIGEEYKSAAIDRFERLALRRIVHRDK